MNGIPSALTALFSSSRFDHTEGAAHFAKLLHIIEVCFSHAPSISPQVFSTPQERRAVVDDVISLYEKLVQNHVPKRLIQLSQYTDQPALQLQCLRALSLYAPGPRIASTPRTSFA